MIKFLIFLSLLIQLSLLNIGYAKEYRNPEAGFKINIPQQEINIVSKNFYGGMRLMVILFTFIAMIKNRHQIY